MSIFQEELARHRESLEGDFIPRLEAAKFLAYMEAEHPEALDVWLRTNAEVFVADALKDILRRERQRILRRATERAFGIAARAAENGNLDDLEVFTVVYAIDTKNTRRKVGDMTGPDHSFVAQGYSISGKKQLMLAEFHSIVARKVGSHRTSEVIPEEIYLKMYVSILGQNVTLPVQVVA